MLIGYQRRGLVVLGAAALRMRIQYARKLSFFIVAVICITTGGTEQRACVSRYGQSA